MSADPKIELLTPDTKLDHLLETYPFLVDALAQRHPHFAKLKNPILRRTIGKLATLKTAASVAGVDLARLFEWIAEAVRERAGDVLAVAAARPPASKDERLATMKEIIRSLHAGAGAEEARRKFTEMVREVSAVEIAEMEQQLIREGLPPDEIKRLCDVHARIFEGGVVAPPSAAEPPPGHPVHTYRAENRLIERLLADLQPLLGRNDAWPEARRVLDRLAGIEKHYARKEYQLFPGLEKKGFTGPSQVMWSVDDDIRKLLQRVRAAADAGDAAEFSRLAPEFMRAATEMIYKEENILFPTAIELLNDAEWRAIRSGEDEIGYLDGVAPGTGWRPSDSVAAAPAGTLPAGMLAMKAGALTLEQVNLVLTHLPVELSFVDETDTVRYYTDQPHKIFPRSPGVIGRKVQNCHPPKSLHLVNRILEDFRAGRRDTADFWIPHKGAFLYIRYLAVRDAERRYRGCLEVVQDVTAIRGLEGERRLLSEE